MPGSPTALIFGWCRWGGRSTRLAAGRARSVRRVPDLGQIGEVRADNLGHALPDRPYSDLLTELDGYLVVCELAPESAD